MVCRSHFSIMSLKGRLRSKHLSFRVTVETCSVFHCFQSFSPLQSSSSCFILFSFFPLFLIRVFLVILHLWQCQTKRLSGSRVKFGLFLREALQQSEISPIFQLLHPVLSVVWPSILPVAATLTTEKPTHATPLTKNPALSGFQAVLSPQTCCTLGTSCKSHLAQIRAWEKYMKSQSGLKWDFEDNHRVDSANLMQFLIPGANKNSFCLRSELKTDTLGKNVIFFWIQTNQI